jgi:hypothetical protein
MIEVLFIEDLKVFRLERDPNYISKWSAKALVYSPAKSAKWYVGEAETPATAVSRMLENHRAGKSGRVVDQGFARTERIPVVNPALAELASKISISL